MQISKTSGVDQEMLSGKFCDSCLGKQPFWLKKPPNVVNAVVVGAQ